MPKKKQKSQQKSPTDKKSSKTKSNKNKSNYNAEDIVLCESFAGPNISMRVLSKVDRLSGLKQESDNGIRLQGFWGCLTSKKDQLALINSCVPYDKKEKPEDCKSFVFDWQVIKVLKRNKKRS